MLKNYNKHIDLINIVLLSMSVQLDKCRMHPQCTYEHPTINPPLKVMFCTVPFTPQWTNIIALNSMNIYVINYSVFHL